MMTKRDKNKVSLNKEKPIIGKLSKSALKSINEALKINTTAQDIRMGQSNLKHIYKGHNKEIIDRIEGLGITQEDYIKLIIKNFNQIRKGNKPNSILLVKLNDNLHDVAVLHLIFYKKENYWEVKTAEPHRTKSLKSKIIWEKSTK